MTPNRQSDARRLLERRCVSYHNALLSFWGLRRTNVCVQGMQEEKEFVASSNWRGVEESSQGEEFSNGNLVKLSR